MTIFCSKKLSALLSRTTSKHDVTFIALIAFILLERKTNLSSMKKYAKIKLFLWDYNAIRK